MSLSGATVPAHVLPMGDAAILVETDSIESVLALEAVLVGKVEAGQGPWAQVRDVVPAARTVLLVADEATNLSALAGETAAALRDVTATGSTGSGETVEVPVSYDGPDLAEVATLTGLSEREVIEAHTGTCWTVGFGGFAPGFAYLVGGDPRLQVPRRSSPRTSVPAGAVALAGEFSAVYPRESPGGWQLIGTTTLPMWNLEQDPPALLRPGAIVQFVEVTP